MAEEDKGLLQEDAGLDGGVDEQAVGDADVAALAVHHAADLLGVVGHDFQGDLRVLRDESLVEIAQEKQVQGVRGRHRQRLVQVQAAQGVGFPVQIHPVLGDGHQAAAVGGEGHVFKALLAVEEGDP